MDWTAILTPTIGAGGLVAVVVVLIFTGRLIPSGTVDRLLASKDAQIASLTAASEKLTQSNDRKDAQITALIEAGRTTTRVIQAVQDAAGLDGGSSRELAQAPSQDR